ncbi:MFS transporter [Phenylobacterium sp.]|uniref:MFS transporter n=1 Tax=Phenylobacterium sp. TaxID=1871053 RepID=UPI0035623928
MTGTNLGAVGSPDIAARIDRLPPTRYVWTLVALVSFGAFFEIYDLALSAPLSLGLLAAGIFHKGAEGLFGLSDQATFVAVTFAGLYVGTLGFSTAADRLGRRPIFTFALIWYALATVVMGFQSTAITMCLWRFIASIGIGLELVAIDCYLAELMPKATRGKAFAISASIQFLSTPLVAVLAWRLIPGEHFGISGWRWLAFLPAIGAGLIWWVRRALPESPRWLEAHGRPDEANAIMTAIETRVQADWGGPLPSPRPRAIAAAANEQVSLWRPPYRRRTLTLVVFHLFQTIGYFGFSNWLPTLLVSQGITISRSLAYTAVLALVPPIAPLVFSRFADKAERKWLVVSGALLAAAAGLLLSRMTQDSNFLVFTAIGASVAVGNSLMSLSYHTYQSEIFPTRMRARGVGLVYSFSRLSAIFSGYIIAFTLEEAGSAGVFVLISIAMVIVALTIGLFGPRTRGLALEEI